MKNDDTDSLQDPTIDRRKVFQYLPFAAGALVAMVLGGCAHHAPVTHGGARRTARRTSRRVTRRRHY